MEREYFPQGGKPMLQSGLTILPFDNLPDIGVPCPKWQNGVARRLGIVTCLALTVIAAADARHADRSTAVCIFGATANDRLNSCAPPSRKAFNPLATWR
jgi:hypothetical protein